MCRPRIDGCNTAILGGRLAPEWLEDDLVWQSGITGKTMTRPKWTLVTHMFNHQTHHRGQVHCMLTQSGVKPDDTDLWMLPE